MKPPSVGRDRIAATEPVIRPHVRRTPVVEVRGRDFGLGDVTLLFKLELLQQSGSFKARGAFANLLLRPVPPAGVVAASGGNHGAAVAHAARELKVPARIFVPTISTQAKVDRIRASGAELVLVGERYADALAASEAWASSSGALPVHAFDQDETMMGAGHPRPRARGPGRGPRRRARRGGRRRPGRRDRGVVRRTDAGHRGRAGARTDAGACARGG